jgi:hypothetical protein
VADQRLVVEAVSKARFQGIPEDEALLGNVEFSPGLRAIEAVTTLKRLRQQVGSRSTALLISSVAG